MADIRTETIKQYALGAQLLSAAPKTAVQKKPLLNPFQQSSSALENEDDLAGLARNYDVTAGILRRREARNAQTGELGTG